MSKRTAIEGLANKTYQPVVNDETPQVLPRPTIANTEALVDIQIRSFVLQTADERADLARQYGMVETIADGEIENEGKTFTVKLPELAEREYLVEVIKVLFPTAPLENNEDNIDVNVVHEAVADFFSLVRPPRPGRQRELTELLLGNLP